MMKFKNGVYSFYWPIKPVEQQRPRATRFGRSLRVYDPPKVKLFKKELADMAKNDWPYQLLACPLAISLKFYRPVQISLSKVERSRRLKNVHRAIVKPDIDNYIKSTLDALNGQIWADDRYIVKIQAEKFYSEPAKARIELGVKKWTM